MMQRRRVGKDPQEAVGDVSIGATQIPLGGEHQFSTTHSRRRTKKAQSSFRSCLIRLRLLGDRRKKSDGINFTKRGGPLCESSISALLTTLIVFLMVALVVFYQAVKWLDEPNSSLILRLTTSIPVDLLSCLEDLRPLGFGKELQVVFYQSKKRSIYNIRDFVHPADLSRKEAREAEYADFGDIDLKLLPDEDQKRQIYIMVKDLQGEARSLDRERDDDMEMYWAFDDDVERNPYNLYNDYDPPTNDGTCRRLPWHRYNLPSCNMMHELDLVWYTPRFIGDGAYREVFVTEQPYMGTTEALIFKELRWDLEMTTEDYEYVRMDAFITERFTSNKHISDIYGYCGLSMLTEYFPFGDIEKDVVGFPHHRKSFNPLKHKELIPFNNFTGAEKLQLSLNMVEPVAALHNYPGGVVVHDDIQLCQYLWTEEDGINVKLNDFNRAEIMLWDDSAQRYCKYKNGKGHGDWRAPEEYKDLPLDETIDIWSLGNNMYSVLTGVYPFFNVEKDWQIQKLLKDGETAAIDPRYVDRSFAERKLIEVIRRCWVYNPEQRADINEIWQMLTDAIAENEKYEKEEEKKRADAKLLEEEIEMKARLDLAKRGQQDAEAQNEVIVLESSERAGDNETADEQATKEEKRVEEQPRKEDAVRSGAQAESKETLVAETEEEI